MIVNQRPYQLVYSKTNNRTLAMTAAVFAKLIGILYVNFSSLFGREYVKAGENARAEIEKLYPKPGHNKIIEPLLPVDEKTELSIIIPAYNAEKYIESCIKSVLSQKTEYTFEIIIVNDNSKDGTLEKLKKFKEFENVKIIDFKNGGSAAKARNEGLIHSVGKNIMFLDADDALCDGALNVLLDKMKNNGADVIQGGWQYIDEEGSKGLSQRYAEKIYDKKSKLSRFDLPGMPWGKIYKRELFEDIRFPSEYTCFEDSVVHFLVFRQAKIVCSVSDNVYYWRKNPEGITQSSQNKVKATESYWIAEELLCLDKKHGLKRDEMFDMCLIGQLTCFLYANVRGLKKDTKKIIFSACCDLYEEAKTTNDKKIPFALKIGERALKEKRFDLWEKQGKLYQLIR